jgi:hypothetical protein
MSKEDINSTSNEPGLLADFYATHHILAADGEGAQAILDLFQASGADIKGRITIVYAETALSQHAYTTALLRLPALVVHSLPTVLAAIDRLTSILGATKLGTRVYAAGSERMIGLVMQLAQASGMDPGSVMSERRDELPYYVHCEQCLELNNNVTTSVVQCAHCGATLVVHCHAPDRIPILRGYPAEPESIQRKRKKDVQLSKVTREPSLWRGV